MARVCEGEPQTGLGELGEAAAPLPALSHYCLCAIHVRPRPLAEGDAVRRAVKDSKLGAADALKRLARSSRFCRKFSCVDAWKGVNLVRQGD